MGNGLDKVLKAIEADDRSVSQNEMVHLLRSINQNLTVMTYRLAPNTAFYPRNQDDPGLDMTQIYTQYELNFGMVVNTLTIMPVPVQTTIRYQEKWAAEQVFRRGEGTTIRNIEMDRVFVTNTAAASGTGPRSRLRIFAWGKEYSGYIKMAKPQRR